MPRLQVVEGPLKGRVFTLEGETVFLGRSPKNDVQINDRTLSRKQLKIFRIGKRYFIEDLKSTNGTMLNGTRIPPGEGFAITPGDTIAMGHTLIRVAGIPEAKLMPVPPPKEESRTASTDTQKRAQRERRSHSSKDRELMYRISELLRDSMELRELIERILNHLLAALPRIDRAVVLLAEDKDRIRETISKSREPQNEGAPLFSRRVVEKVLTERKAVRMSDTTYESPEDFSVSGDTLEIRSILCVPVISHSQLMGVLYVDSFRGPYGFRKEDVLLLDGLSGTLALAVENASLISQMDFLEERKAKA